MSARKSQVCTDKNIACYRERTAITSLNKSRHEQHKKAGDCRRLQPFAGDFWVNTGRVQPLQIPVSD